MVSAILLGLAGVPDETIVADYTLSAPCLWDRDVEVFREQFGPEATLDEFRDEYCPANAMALVLRHVHTSYGGVADYVAHIGLSEAGAAPPLEPARLIQRELRTVVRAVHSR